MGIKKEKISGTTFVEILLALGIAGIAAAATLAMLRAAEYQLEKSRVEALLAGHTLHLRESFLSMPYFSLVDLFPSGRDSVDISQEGHLPSETPRQFPWKLDVHIERFNHNSANEYTTVNMALSWHEPSQGFPRTQNQTRRLSLPPFLRRRF
jgi:hypothetical protein